MIWTNYYHLQRSNFARESHSSIGQLGTVDMVIRWGFNSSQTIGQPLNFGLASPHAAVDPHFSVPRGFPVSGWPWTCQFTSLLIYLSQGNNCMPNHLLLSSLTCLSTTDTLPSSVCRVLINFNVASCSIQSNTRPAPPSHEAILMWLECRGMGCHVCHTVWSACCFETGKWAYYK